MTTPDTGADRAQRLPTQLRQFRLDVQVAASRMDWDRDWPLDRLMCAAADEIEWLLQQGAVKDAEIARLVRERDDERSSFESLMGHHHATEATLEKAEQAYGALLGRIRKYADEKKDQDLLLLLRSFGTE